MPKDVVVTDLVNDPQGAWVQVERKAHVEWSKLIRKSPIAARTMHIITSGIGRNNAFVIPLEDLARIVDCSTRRLRDAIKLLVEGNWIEVRQIGKTRTVNAYVVNDRVAWSGARDGRRHSMFSATVYVSEDDQPDRDTLSSQAALRRPPPLFPVEFSEGFDDE